MRFRHPDGTVVHLGYCTNVHPAEDARRGPRPAAPTTPAPVRGPRSASTGSASACGWPAPTADRAGRRPGGRRAAARPRWTAHGLEVRHAQRLPVPAASTPRWSSTTSTAPTGPTAARLRLHPRLRPGAGRTCCPTTPPAAASRRCRWAGASPWATPTGTPRRTRAGRAGRRAAPRSRADTGRTVRVGSSPSRAAWWRPPREAVRRLRRRRPRVPRRLPRHLPPRRRASRTPAEALDAAPDAGLPVVKVQASAALHADDPSDPATRAALATLRRGPRSCTRPASRRTTVGWPPTTSPRRSTAAAAARPAALAGALPRARCTPDPTPPLRSTARRSSRRRSTALVGGPSAADRPPRGRDLHLVGAAARTAPDDDAGARPPASPPSSRWVARPAGSTCGLDRRRSRPHDDKLAGRSTSSG